MRTRSWVFLAIGVAIIGFSALNSSVIAPKPTGSLKLVSHRGFAPPPTGPDTGGCTAQAIGKPDYVYVENTLAGIERAFSSHGDWVQVDVRRSGDGKAILFRDESLDCRTNGKGKVSDMTAAALAGLDAGHGYSFDGGKTFPLRGKSGSKIPLLSQVLIYNPGLPFILDIREDSAEAADAVLTAITEANRPMDDKFAFSGGPKAMARIAEKAPGRWIWDSARAEACASGYFRTGWLGMVPEACRNGTIVVNLDQQWLLWGWPHRFLQRMADANTRVVVAGPKVDGGPLSGITKLDQLDDVPNTFKGYLLVEDIDTIGQGLRGA